MRLAASSSPFPRAWFHRRLLILPSASAIQETMWNPSGTRSAFGHHSCTHESIRRAPSPVTIQMEAPPLRRVNCRKNRSNTSLPYPSYARIDPASLVVDSHGDVRVTLPVAGLGHANRRETVERRRHSGPGPAGDPAGDVARGAPCDIRETTHGLLAGHRHQARALHLEIPGEPAAGLRPRHRRDDHAAHGAVDARHHGDQPHPPAAEILAPPMAHAAAPIMTTSPPPAARAARHHLPGAHGPQARAQDAAGHRRSSRTRRPCP